MTTVLAALLAALAAVAVAAINLVGSVRNRPLVNERIAELERRVDQLTSELGDARLDAARARDDAATAHNEVLKCQDREQGLWAQIRILQGGHA